VDERSVEHRLIGVEGDPFVAASRARERDEECHCYDGWYFVGRIVESDYDLSGEEILYERVPCKRCS
jgi:hypothetical protein